MIPRIIHQVWVGGKPFPAAYEKWAQSFRDRLPGWDYHLWQDAEIETFIRGRFPQHLTGYLALPKPAQKADFARYMILASFGGLYADADCECRRPLDFVADADELIVAPELQTTSRKVMTAYRTKMNEIICQWAFLCRAEHPFLLALVEEVGRRVGRTMSDDFIENIVLQTGPGVFTEVLKTHLAGGGTARIVPGSYFGCPDGRNVLRFTLSYLSPISVRTNYIRHHPATSWVDPKMKREWFIRNFFFLGPPKPRKHAAS